MTPAYDEDLHAALHCVAEGYTDLADPMDLDRLIALGLIDLDQTRADGSYTLTNVGRQTIKEWSK